MKEKEELSALQSAAPLEAVLGHLGGQRSSVTLLHVRRALRGGGSNRTVCKAATYLV